MKENFSEEKALFFRITLETVNSDTIALKIYRFFPNGDNREEALLETLTKGSKKAPLTKTGVRDFVAGNVFRYKSQYSWVIEPSTDVIEYYVARIKT